MKAPKHIGSISLVVLAAALAAYVLVVDRHKVSDRERADRPKNVLAAFRREALSRIEITTDKERLVFERRIEPDAGDGAWRMTSPRDEIPEPDVVDRLVGALEFGTFLRKVDAGTPGLEPVRARVTVTMAGLTESVALGQPAASPEGAAFATVDGNARYVVSRDFAAALLKPSDEYRSRSIVPYLSIDLARLEVEGGGQKWAIARKDDVSLLFADTGTRASRERLDRVWLGLADMRAEAFLADADDKDPRFVVRMTPKDAAKPPGELAVLGPCPSRDGLVVVVRRAPTRLAACVPASVVDALATPRASLVDARLFATREDEVEELSLASLPQGVRIELARKGSGFHLRAPEDRDLTVDEVDTTNALVGTIVRAEGTLVPHADPCRPVSRVSVVRTETRVNESVEVARCEDGTVVAVRQMDGATLRLAAPLARRLVPSLALLRGASVVAQPLDPRDVSRVALRCGTPQEFSRPGSQWQIDAPAGQRADHAGVVTLVDRLAHARADAWISDDDDPAFELGKSRCVATVYVRAGTSVAEVTFDFGAEAEGGVYGRVHDGRLKVGARSPVFLAPRALRDAVARIYLDLTAVAVDVSRAENLRISMSEHARAFAIHGGRLELADGGAVPRSEELLRAISGLRADAVAHLGAPVADEGFDRPSLVVESSAGAGSGAPARRVVFGRTTLRENQKLAFARATGVDATFLVAVDRVDAIAGAL